MFTTDAIKKFYDDLSSVDINSLEFGSMNSVLKGSYNDDTLRECLKQNKIERLFDIKYYENSGNKYDVVTNPMYMDTGESLSLLEIYGISNHTSRITFFKDRGFYQDGEIWFEIDSTKINFIIFCNRTLLVPARLNYEIDLSDDEFSTELLMNKLISEVGFNVQIKPFIRILRLILFCRSNGIYLHALGFSTEFYLQDKLISIYERLLGMS